MMGSRRRDQTRQEETRGDVIRKKIAETADAPKDVIMGLPLIHLTGQCEVCIENYRGILEYTEEPCENKIRHDSDYWEKNVHRILYE